MLSFVRSATLFGLQPVAVNVEVDVASSGLPYTIMVGLPNTAVKESADRVKSALHNVGIRIRAKKVTINLSPATVPKQGAMFDLPIALGLLRSHELIPPISPKMMVVGELSLDGKLQPVHGAIAYALLAKQQHMTSILLPKANADEVALVQGIDVLLAETLQEVINHCRGRATIAARTHHIFHPPTSTLQPPLISGLHVAKRALTIAAAGRHHMLVYGSPGRGKTLLADLLMFLLPPLSSVEALEVLPIYSSAGLPCEAIADGVRPFRSPHTTITPTKLFGGERDLSPGEITLAHRGVLFLDELPQFQSSCIEGLRKPLEQGSISLRVQKISTQYPCRFQLFAAMNACPCGYRNTKHPCSCTGATIMRYQKKISGPIHERIDMRIGVQEEGFSLAVQNEQTIRSEYAQMKEKIARAKKLQEKRYHASPVCANAELTSTTAAYFCDLTRDAQIFLDTAAHTLHLSPRRYTKVLAVSQTITDLADHRTIAKEDVGEALQYCKQEQ